MNSSTYIELINYSNRGAFYDLFIKGQEGSERDMFKASYSSDPQLAAINQYVELIEQEASESDIIVPGYFRIEHDTDKRFVAIPGLLPYHTEDGTKVKSKDIGLRLFCWKPTSKTLIYMNGYKHTDRRRERWQDTYFAPKGEELLRVMSRLTECVNPFRYIKFNDEGFICNSDGEILPSFEIQSVIR